MISLSELKLRIRNERTELDLPSRVIGYQSFSDEGVELIALWQALNIRLIERISMKMSRKSLGLMSCALIALCSTSSPVNQSI